MSGRCPVALLDSHPGWSRYRNKIGTFWLVLMHDLSALRRAIAAIEPASSEPRADALFGFGADDLDSALGGGLSRAALHEIYARRQADCAAAAGFGLCLALRAAGGRPLLWARQEFGDVEAGALHGAGLVALGARPEAMLVVRLRDAGGVLRAADEGARCGALGAVVAELWGDPRGLDLKASRRLSLAAASSGAALILVRQAAEPRPSSAQSRWSVASAPSTPLEANAPGRPAFDIALLRHRAGVPPRSWRLEWDHDHLSFALPPLSRGVAAFAADGAAGARASALRRRAG
ncbi:ImuA family protein [Methylopila musalis]|uniref:ImuA family protein n=1 Tax=Methylopila musalis TaxID=1134781 RepID=A0ABW3ZA65_9HYPH